MPKRNTAFICLILAALLLSSMRAGCQKPEAGSLPDTSPAATSSADTSAVSPATEAAPETEAPAPAVISIGGTDYPADIDRMDLILGAPGEGASAANLDKLASFDKVSWLLLNEYEYAQELSLEPLSKMPALEELALAGHRGAVTGLENCSRLTAMQLVECQDISLPALKLEGLNISRCENLDWNSVGQLENLLMLHLDDCFPEDMSFLPSLTRLHAISMVVHFDLIPEPEALGNLPLTLTAGDEIPDWVPGDAAALKDFLKQEERELVIFVSPHASEDCRYCKRMAGN